MESCAALSVLVLWLLSFHHHHHQQQQQQQQQQHHSWSAVILSLIRNASVIRKPQHSCSQAPEVLQRNYSYPADLWSVGVITYILVR